MTTRYKYSNPIPFRIYRTQKEFLNGDLEQVYENIYKKKKKLNKLVVVSDFKENVSHLRSKYFIRENTCSTSRPIPEN